MTGAPAFDREAARYDELWTNTAAGRAQRDQVWTVVDAMFDAGCRVLDVGCGTGEDAAHMAGRGISVHATDASPAMIQVALRRGGFTAGVLRAEEIGEAPGVFGGAISNFGALNCLADLPAFARALAPRVRSGGRVALCTMGRFCLWETLWYAVHLRFDKAFRRVRGRADSSLGITVRYPTVAQLEQFFAPDFRLERWRGVGLFVPPSFVRLPAGAVKALGAMDRVLARVPGLRGLADHRLAIFVRK